MLDTANRERGAAHAMAGNYLRDLTHAQEALRLSRAPGS